MATNVIGHVIGADKQVFDGVDTVADVKKKLGIEGQTFAATVNGEPAEDSDEVNEGDYVTFARAVKGGL